MRTPQERIHLPRRSCLAVPGSSQRMLEKAVSLNTDALFLDLEDAVSPLAKVEARNNIVAALNAGGFGERIVSVRINAVDTEWSLDDVQHIMREAGHAVDCIMLPKTQTVAHVNWLVEQLDALEKEIGKPVGSTGIELQIEDALGLVNVDAIAASSERIETLVFGPADFMASINMRTLVVGQQPSGYVEGDAYHYILMRLLIAGRAFGRQVIDGPYLAIKDLDGLRKVSERSAALGFDGKWVLHPDQVDVVNDVYSPAQADYNRAELILDAYAHSTSAEGGARGAVMLGDEMIDEASRKMALVVAGKGRAAGLKRTQEFTAPK